MKEAARKTLENLLHNVEETAARHALDADPAWRNVREYAERLSLVLRSVLTLEDKP